MVNRYLFSISKQIMNHIIELKAKIGIETGIGRYQSFFVIY